MVAKRRQPFSLSTHRVLKIPKVHRRKDMMRERKFQELNDILLQIPMGFHMHFVLPQRMLLIEMEQDNSLKYLEIMKHVYWLKKYQLMVDIQERILREVYKHLLVQVQKQSSGVNFIPLQLYPRDGQQREPSLGQRSIEDSGRTVKEDSIPVYK